MRKILIISIILVSIFIQQIKADDENSSVRSGNSIEISSAELENDLVKLRNNTLSKESIVEQGPIEKRARQW
jgi:hypothetical protein